MTEPKADIFSTTGSHRAWVGERVVNERVLNGQTETRLPLREAARPWPGRQPSSNARHAAITKNLSHFTNYKSWADKVKSDWKKDKPE
jgi:hypothetical protein